MRILSALAGLVLGGIFGLGTALAAAGIIGPGVLIGGSVQTGGWSSDWTIGSKAANPWTRARVARHGLFALTKEEAVYFSRKTDDDGRRLRETCTYEVSGGALPALWWSITLYDGTSFLPRNTDEALSFDLTDASAIGDPTAWAFTIAAAAQAEGGWVSSRAAGEFDLTLRLYKPSPELIANPEAVLDAPRIRMVTCRELP